MAKGLCVEHYYRKKKYGRLEKIREPQGAECRVAGCGRKPVSLQLCRGHHTQHRNGYEFTPLAVWKHPASLIDPSPANGGKRGSRITQVFNEIRGKAVQRGKEWNLTHEDLLQLVRGPCFYCRGESRWPSGYTGIDRVDNSRGYEPGNVVGCCKHCNSAKGSRTVDEFREWAFRLYRTLFPEP